MLDFPPFRLDAGSGKVYRGEAPLQLTPKAFAVLHYLLAHAGRLVSKDELLDAVWPHLHVSEAVLKVCILEIRKALEDAAATPRFVETVRGRGYRFIAALEGQGAGAAAQALDPIEPPMVGRGAEIGVLEAALQTAVAGAHPQLVFVVGEPGIGKTTLIEAFATALPSRSAGAIRVARGQCIEQGAAGEAYLPVLQSLSALARDAPSLVSALRRHAPTWLAQLPALVARRDRAALGREIVGSTPARMLREMTEALESFTAEAPLVLILEDLHWSDQATIDLVAAIGRSLRPCRILVIGTYRPLEVDTSPHGLQAVRHELSVHRRCRLLALELLPVEAVAEYLDRRYPGHSFPPALARLVHERTEGTPLFMRDVIDGLEADGKIALSGERWTLAADLEDLELAVPASLRHLIERQLDRLGAKERDLVEAASVCGGAFSAPTVAAASGRSFEQVEAMLDLVATRHGIVRSADVATEPDGSAATGYEFVHSTYQRAIYERIGEARRRRLHLRIGKHREALAADRSSEIAAELAHHFDAARDARRAIHYLRLVAETASIRQASRDAVLSLDRALELARLLPEPDRSAERIATLERLGVVRRGMGDARRAAAAFEEAAAGAKARGDRETESRVLFYLASTVVWLDSTRCLSAAAEAITASEHLADESMRARARGAAGYWHSLLRGWRSADAEACTSALDAARRTGDRALLCLLLGRQSYFQTLRSAYREASASAVEGMRLARAVDDFYELGICFYHRAIALFYVGEWGELARTLEEGRAMAARNGHARWLALVDLYAGWLALEAGDDVRAGEMLEETVERARATRYRYGQAMALALLGRTHLYRGDLERASRLLAEGAEVIETTGPRDWMIQMPLTHGLAACALAQRSVERARAEAERLRDFAAGCGERTWLALAWQTLAEASMLEDDGERSERELEQAMVTLQGTEAPLAEWRVYDCAARLYRKGGRERQAAAFDKRRALILRRLSAALGSDRRQRRLAAARISGR